VEYCIVILCIRRLPQGAETYRSNNYHELCCVMSTPIVLYYIKCIFWSMYCIHENARYE